MQNRTPCTLYPYSNYLFLDEYLTLYILHLLWFHLPTQSVHMWHTLRSGIISICKIIKLQNRKTNFPHIRSLQLQKHKEATSNSVQCSCTAFIDFKRKLIKNTLSCQVLLCGFKETWIIWKCEKWPVPRPAPVRRSGVGASGKLML